MNRYEFSVCHDKDDWEYITAFKVEDGNWVYYHDAVLLYQQLKDVVGALEDVLRGDDGEAYSQAERVLISASKVLDDLK